MRREVLIELRAREEVVRQRLEDVRVELRALRARTTRTGAPDAPYRSEQTGSTPMELAAAVAEENTLLLEREKVRRGLADAGIHTSLPSAPTREATSCPARWGEMDGDERARVCARCRKRVYDVDGLSTEEIDRLVLRAQPESTLYRRADGTLIAGDCPVGSRRNRITLAGVGLGGVVALGALAFVLEHPPHQVKPMPPQPPTPKSVTVDGPRPPKTLVVDESKLSPEEKAFVEAAFVHPNHDKRLAAARALLAKGSWSTFLTTDRDDYAALRNEIDPSKKPLYEGTILDGAILSGDRELLAAVVRDAPAKEGKSWVSYETRVGAIRCLLGDEAGGLAALRNADKLARSDHQPFEPNDHVRAALVSERADAHLAAIACGAPLEPPESDPALDAEEDMLAALGYPSRTTYHRGDSLDALVRAAPQIAQTGKLDPKARAPWVSAWRFLTPRSIFVRGNHESAPVVALATVERAAARVESSSKDAACYLWLAAAEERVRRGDLDGARKDTQRAEADMPPDTLPLSVPLRLAIGDAHDAETAIAKVHASSEDDRLQLLFWRVLTHVASSEWNDAAGDARSLDANAMTATLHRAPDVRQWTTISAWLRAALAWRTGMRESVPRGPQPPANLAAWSDAPWTTPEARRTLRISEAQYHMATPLPNDMSAPVRGAVIYLMGEVAAGEGDVDVWLDALDRMLLPARAYFADRAAAAHLRGDEAAATKWRERSSRWSALIHDDATAVLASVAGL